jgi:predicted ATPase
LRVAEEMLQEHPDGVWFVDLAPLQDEAHVVQAVAGAMGIRAEPGASVQDAIRVLVAPQRALILLDNCEHLLGACAQVAQHLVASGPGVRVLATSRQGLGISGEAIYAVGPMGTPPEALDRRVETVERFDAVQLFVDRARQVVHGFGLDTETAGAAAEICRALDGMPLAIELAAARVRVLGLSQILSRLDQRFR